MAVKKKSVVVDPKVSTLLAEVLANPADDDARLVYADALIAAGDPRGEFIAVQVELAKRGDKTEKQDKKTKPLWDKFRELHSKHSGKWNKPVKQFGREARWWWHRGFLRAIEINTMDTDGAKWLADILAGEPVVDLSTGADKKQLDVPGIERVERLAIHDEKPAQAIAQAKRLVNIRELRIGTHVKDAGMLALVKPAALGKVTHLSLGAPGVKSAASLAKLAASPLGKRLEIFEWLREDVTPDVAKIVLAMPKLHTFVYSYGYADETRDVLAKKFGDRLVEEDEGGTDYIFEGVTGVSHRRLPYP
ncbi:MAG: TIGR02996 domain-containing protein [Myxococcota bacterium]|nr:TIGR02996 domain-containing protein [Deltaproteobacteria bacterium]MDQ3339569.1 TIGR02996 domain-containing protein [Myxococcota bacterium]